MCSFDQTWNICDHQRAKVSEIDNTQVRLESRKRIVGDLRLRGRNGREKGDFARIGKPDRPDVSKQFHLELQLDRFAFVSLLVKTRRLFRRSRKVRIAETASTTSSSEPTRAIYIEIL